MTKNKTKKIPRNFVALGASLRKWGAGPHVDKRLKRMGNLRSKRHHGFEVNND